MILDLRLKIDTNVKYNDHVRTWVSMSLYGHQDELECPRLYFDWLYNSSLKWYKDTIHYDDNRSYFIFWPTLCMSMSAAYMFVCYIVELYANKVSAFSIMHAKSAFLKTVTCEFALERIIGSNKTTVQSHQSFPTQHVLTCS